MRCEIAVIHVYSLHRGWVGENGERPGVSEKLGGGGGCSCRTRFIPFSIRLSGIK